MKLFTITCHDVYNYGASLQAYALQNYLISLGHECHIIDYKPDYLRRNYNFWYIDKDNRFYKICQKSKLFHFFYALRLAPMTFKTWGRIKPFDRFKKNYLSCTERYNSLQELQQIPPQGDAYLAGSDQIWNCNLPNGRDNAFFLDFGPSTIKRIAYAASIGISYFPEEEKERIKKLLTAFNSISVREKSGAKVIESLGFCSSTVCDPVLLLSKNKWEQIIPNKKPEKRYILLYDIFEDDLSIKDGALRISSELGLPIYSINDSHKCKYANKNISNAGPIEFLWYINNADYVISNSFHATAFSVLLNKQFSTFYNKSNSSRMTDFLEAMELSAHFNPKNMSIVNNWDVVNSRLDDFIAFSKLFLEKSLE